MAIITVSRQANSYGDEIAKRVAEVLGYDFIDKQMIGQALAHLGLSTEQMDRFDEKKPSIWDALAIQKNKFLCLMKAVIYDFAEKDHTVILGRGSQCLLQDLPGTLHVRIVAPFKVRLRRLVEQDEHDEKSADRMLRKGDRDSSGYIRSFFNADWNDPDYYDLLVNTQTLSIATATEMITRAIQSEEFKCDPKARSDKLAALALEQKAEVAIMEIQKGNTIFASVADIDQGIVTLTGVADSEAIKQECGMVVSAIDGVKGVKNEIGIIKAVYR